MPLSTSNSSCPVRGPWCSTIGLALAISLGLLGAIEAGWRCAGIEPSFPDNPGIWSIARKEASEVASPIVVIGSSKALAGIHPRVLANGLGKSAVIQLAWLGAGPLPLLAELAQDPGFSGTVLCEVHPALVFGTKAGWEHPWIDYYYSSNIAERAEFSLRTPIESRLSLRHGGADPIQVARGLLRGSMPSGLAQSFDVDRTFRMDFTQYSPRAIQEHGASEARRANDAVAMGSDELRAHVARITELVSELRRRGGQVVFVRMPSTGQVLEGEERIFPRHETWDVLLRTTGAKGFHFQDDHELSRFSCPDGVHLDGRDAEKFSALLAVRLAQAIPSDRPRY